MSEETTFARLSVALGAIPVPVKEKEPGAGDAGFVEREVIHSISMRDLLALPEGAEVLEGSWRHQLMGALAVLNWLGVVRLERPTSRTTSSMEELSVSASSEPAGYVLQGLSRLLTEPLGHASPIRADSRVTAFASILHEAIARGIINPHLVLANVLAVHRKDAERDGLREVRNISVLIKGGWSGRGAAREAVYLHTYKPEYHSYSLPGAVPAPGWNDEETARFALREEIETPAERFKLQASGVEDAFDIRLTVTRGTYSQYAFNLFAVTAIDGALRIRTGVRHRSFTFGEMCRCMSHDGEAILPKGGLLENLAEQRGVDWIPQVVIDPGPDLGRSIRSEGAAVARELSHVARAGGRLARLIALLYGSAWKYVAWLLAVVVVLVLFRPVLDREFPGLGNLAALLTLAMFLREVIKTISHR